MPTPPDGFPFGVSAEDIPYATACAAYAWNSMVPEHRARREQADYLGELYSVWSDFAPKIQTDEDRAKLTAHVQQFRERLRRHYLVMLAARSRTANPMVTGPAKFPTERNRKRMDSEQKRVEEYLEWKKRARAAIARDMAPPPPEPADEIARMEAQRDKMKAINAEYRKCKGDIDAMQIPSERLKETMKATRAQDVYYQRTGKFQPFQGYELTSLNGKIERLRVSVAADARRAAVITTLNAENVAEPEIALDGGVRIVDNVRDDRVQVFFPGKPESAMRDKLKGGGFRWSPNAGAWQAYRSSNTVYRLRQLFGIEFKLQSTNAPEVQQ